MPKSTTPHLLYRGDAFRELIEGMRPLVEHQAARLLAKGRTLPGVRVREYIDAQSSPTIRAALERLMGGRRWRYVSFYDFRGALERVARKLFTELGIVSSSSSSSVSNDICFVVDSLRKSSFWVVAVALLAVPPDSWARLALAVDDDDGPAGGLVSAFSELRQGSSGTRLVLMDDATYSGDQLSYFHDVVVEAWQEAEAAAGPRGLGLLRGKKTGIRVDVAVPFMSVPSIPLFKNRRGRLTRLMYEESFASLFHRRTLASMLAADVYLLRESAIVTEYQSFFFDFLGVLPTNTLVIFEHKVADSLSIPNRWLQLGPCLRSPHPTDTGSSSSSPSGAYRIRPELARQLAGLLRRDLRERRAGASWGGISDNGPGSPSQRLLLAASRRICELMQVRTFRTRFAQTVSLAPDRPSPPAFFPLIPPEFCDPRYRRFVMSRLRRMSSSASSITVADEMPPCRRPPYKRSSFRRRLNKTFLSP
jgi:hypothetical protein